MSRLDQFLCNSRACWRDLLSQKWDKFLFHSQGLFRAVWVSDDMTAQEMGMCAMLASLAVLVTVLTIKTLH